MAQDISDGDSFGSGGNLRVRQASGMAYEWDRNRGLVLRSDGIHALVGVDPKSAPTSSDWWFDRVHPDDIARVRLTGFAVDRADALRVLEYRVRTESGDYRHVWDRRLLVRDPSGAVVRVIGLLFDVTDGWLAEERSRRIETQYKVLADLVPAIVFSADGNGLGDYYNRYWRDYTGLDLSASIAAQKNGWRGVIHDDDRPAVFAAWTTASRTGAPFEATYRLRRHDGVWRWFTGRSVPIADESGGSARGGPARSGSWVGSAVDIDVQKRAQESSRFLAEVSATLDGASETTSEAVETILERIMTNLAADGVNLLEVRDEGGRETFALRQIVERVPRNRAATLAGLDSHLDTYFSPDMLETLRAGRGLAFSDLASDPRYPGSLAQAGKLLAPLIEEGRFHGILAVWSETPRLWQPDEIDLMERIGERMARALERERLRNILLAETRERFETQHRLASLAERHRILLESAVDYAIIGLDADGGIELFSSGATAIFGYDPPAILGQPLAVLFTPEDRAAGVPRAELEEASRTGKAGDDRWMARADGSCFFASGSVYRLNLADHEDESPGFVKILRDRTGEQVAQERLEALVAQRTAALDRVIRERQSLFDALIRVQEEERRKLSRELHDEMGQHLTALSLGLKTLEARVDGDREARAKLFEQLRRGTERLTRETHRIAVRLRPTALDDLGAICAIQAVTEEWSVQCSIPADFQCGLPAETRFSPQAETVLYRVAQEALRNIARHADARRVSVALTRSDTRIVLLVEDDGRGFDAASPGLGIVGMRERLQSVGGTLTIESRPGGGTTIIARVPLDSSSEPTGRQTETLPNP